MEVYEKYLNPSCLRETKDVILEILLLQQNVWRDFSTSQFQFKKYRTITKNYDFTSIVATVMKFSQSIQQG